MSETLRGLEIVLAGGTGGLGSETAHLLAAEGARLVHLGRLREIWS